MNKTTLTLCVAAIATMTLSGCANSLTGIGGSDKLACKAPDGVTCSSLSGVYANALADNLPGLQKKQRTTTTTKTTEVGDIPTGMVTTKNTAATSYSGPGTTSIIGTTPSSGTPILTPPHVMRVWIAPWEDAEGDLHDQAYIYVVANSGHWAIAHNEQQIMNRYRPTFIKKAEQQAAQTGGAYEKKVTTNNASTNPSSLPMSQGYSSTAPSPSGLPSGMLDK